MLDVFIKRFLLKALTDVVSSEILTWMHSLSSSYSFAVANAAQLQFKHCPNKLSLFELKIDVNPSYTTFGIVCILLLTAKIADW